VTREITGSRRSLSTTCSATGQNLTLATRCEGRLMPHSGGFELLALPVGCAPIAELSCALLLAILDVLMLDAAPPIGSRALGISIDGTSSVDG
jgi:hypothetical protein